jgi:hypothetical protein
MFFGSQGVSNAHSRAIELKPAAPNIKNSLGKGGLWTRTYTALAADLRSLSNMVPPVHPTMAVQYVFGSAQIRSTW